MTRQYWTVGIGIVVTSYVILYLSKIRSQLSSKTRFDKAAEKDSLSHIQKKSVPPNYVHQPLTIRSLTLRNRCIKSATFESASLYGRVTDELINFHKKQALNAALVTVSYGCISPEGRTFPHQLLLLPENKEGLKRLCNRIHNETDSKISIQLTHAGLMAEPFDDEYTQKYDTKGLILSASAAWSMSAFQFATKMDSKCIKTKINQFAESALLCKQCGFDAVTLHCGHGYLISQFVSRITNNRDDEYGADSLANRCRFASEIVTQIRNLCGDDFPILIKINSHDGVDEQYGGVTVDESIEFCKILIQNGADVIIPTAGVILKNGIYMMRGKVPIGRMAREAVSWVKRIGIGMFGPWIIENRKFRPMFLWETSLKLLNGLKLAEKRGEIEGQYFVCYLGGITCLDDINKAFASGFELVAMGRALLREPDFLERITKDSTHVSLCDHENRCIIGQMSGKPLRCYAFAGDIEDLK